MICGDVGIAVDGDQEWTMKLGTVFINVATCDVSRDIQQNSHFLDLQTQGGVLKYM
jgi:hypothetical protein